MKYPEAQQLFADHLEKNQYDHAPEQLYEPLNYLLNNAGKRIRPALVLMSNHLFNGSLNKALPAAMAVEVFHNFTLMHDDIMDNADLRRGKPSVHKHWDEPTAILSGDVMLVKAYDQLLNARFKDLSEAIRLFNDMASQVCEGQMKDMTFPENVDAYLDMIRQKTAVLLGFCLQIGALSAGASQEHANSCYHIGVDAGISFQIIDDVIDAFSSTEQLGKKAQGDIYEGKKTILFHLTCEIIEADQLDGFKKLYAEPLKSSADVQKIMDVFQKLNIRSKAESLANEYFQKAEMVLRELPQTTENKEDLLKLLQFLKDRNY